MALWSANRFYLVSPLEGKPMLSSGSKSTGLIRGQGPDGPREGILDCRRLFVSCSLRCSWWEKGD